MPIINSSRQTTLVSQYQKADNPWLRMKGLLGRKSLQDDALWIKPCNSIHMLFMSFPIDVVFLDREQKVVGLAANIKPFHFSPIFWKASSALELPTGTIASSQTKEGDSIQFS